MHTTGHAEIIFMLEPQLDFFNAVVQGDTARVKRLLDSGLVNIDARDEEGKSATALFMAASQGHVEVLRLLIKNGADVNTPSKVSE